MVFCVKCGTENPDGSKFCSNCGSELIIVKSEASSATYPEGKYTETYRQPPVQNACSAYNISKQSEPSGAVAFLIGFLINGLVTFLLGVIIGLIVYVISIFIYYLMNNNKMSGEFIAGGLIGVILGGICAALFVSALFASLVF